MTGSAVHTDGTYLAELRCMLCGALRGYEPGYTMPDAVSHGIGDCCQEWSDNNYATAMNHAPVTVMQLEEFGCGQLVVKG